MQHHTQLEKNYLANVLLCCDSIETICKFILVNKKCDDVRNYLRINPLLKRKIGFSYDIFNKHMSSKIFDLFPKIQTLQITGEELLEFQDRIPQIEKIVLLTIPEETHLIQPFRDKISEINGKIFSDKIDFSLFPILSKARLEVCSFGLHFPNKKQKLDLLRIRQHSCCEELYCLADYENFHHIIVEVFDTIKFYEIDVINRFATIICNDWNPTMDPRIITFHHQDLTFIPSNLLTSNVIYVKNKLNYPKALTVNCADSVIKEVNVNLSECGQIHELRIIYDNTHNNTIVFPCETRSTHLQLKKLSLIGRENKVIDNNFVTNLALCYTKDIYDGLTELTLKKCNSDFLFNISNLQRLKLDTLKITYSLSTLTSLSYLTLDKCKIISLPSKTFFPSSICKLELFTCDEEIVLKLKELQSYNFLNTLSMSGRSIESSKMNLSKFKSLKSLYLFQTTFKKYPICLEELKLGFFDNLSLNFSSLSHLTDVMTCNCNFIQLNLPNSIQRMTFDHCQPLIENISELTQFVELNINCCPRISWDFIPRTLTKLVVLPSSDIDWKKINRIEHLKHEHIN